MSLCEIRWFSTVLRKQVGTYVILPDNGKPPFATFYLLHGLSDDYTIWLRRTRIEWYVRNLPLIVVMPDGGRGFYTNNARGPAYGRYVGEELPSFIERNFPARPARAARCIGGLSMGGYGALRVALAHPDRFASANSHSGALAQGSLRRTNRPDILPQEEFAAIFGSSPKGTDHDLFNLAQRAAKAKQLPHLRFDCGTDDFLIAQNRQFHAQLTTARIPHEYEEFPGDHNWDYWDQHIREAIAFHAANLHLKPTAP